MYVSWKHFFKYFEFMYIVWICVCFFLTRLVYQFQNFCFTSPSRSSFQLTTSKCFLLLCCLYQIFPNFFIYVFDILLRKYFTIWNLCSQEYSRSSVVTFPSDQKPKMVIVVTFGLIGCKWFFLKKNTKKNSPLLDIIRSVEIRHDLCPSYEATLGWPYKRRITVPVMKSSIATYYLNYLNDC